MRLDAELTQQVKDGRRNESVAFQFDDDNVVHEAIVVGHDIVETQVQVNCQPFRLALVDKCNAVEAILQLLTEQSGSIAQVFTKEIVIC